MKNKKGESIFVNIFSPTFIFALIALIIFFIFLSSGGSSIITQITEFLKSIPAWIYVIIGLLILLNWSRSGTTRRRRR